MSDYHITRITTDGRNALVVFHIPIPVENNSATPTKALRDAVAEYVQPVEADGTFGTFQTTAHGVVAQELTDLQNGLLYEHSENVHFLAGISDGAKQTQIDGKFTSLSSSVLTKIRAQLKFWGHARDVS